MRMRGTTTVTLTLLAFLVFLGALDAFSIENARLLTKAEEPVPEEPPAPVATTGSGLTAPPTPANAQPGTRKQLGPNVLNVLAAQGFTAVDPKKEKSLLEQVIPADVAKIRTVVLLKEGDRAGLFAWTDSPQVKIYFLALKEALHSTFSPQMRNLVDETQEREGKPVRSLLTFLDPAIDSERIVFVRVRERLYEFHVAEGKDDAIFDLMEALTE